LPPTFVFLQWCASEAASCPRHQTLNEDINFGLHVTAPLKKHFVGCSFTIHITKFKECHLFQTSVRPKNVRSVRILIYKSLKYYFRLSVGAIGLMSPIYLLCQHSTTLHISDMSEFVFFHLDLSGLRKQSSAQNLQQRMGWHLSSSATSPIPKVSQLKVLVHIQLESISFVQVKLQPTFVFLQWCAYEAASCPRHKTLNEDINFGLHVTAPLKKHFVGRWAFCRPFLNK